MSEPKKTNKRFRVFRLLITGAFLLVSVLLVILFFFSMEQTVTALGTVKAACDVKVYSPMEGRVAAVLKGEGDAVPRGAPILEFDCREWKARLQDQKDIIRDLEAQLDVKMGQLSVVEKNPLPGEFRHAKIDVEESSRKLAQSKERVAQHRILHKKNLIPGNELEQVELACMQDEARYQKAIANQKRVESGLGEAIVGKARREVALARIRLGNARRKRAYLEERLKDFVLRSPEQGRLSDFSRKEGELLGKGDLICRVVMSEEKKVRAYVDEKSIRDVRSGQNVRIYSHLYDKIKHGTFMGEVDRIREVPEEVDGKVAYRVDIKVTQEPHPLRPGSTAEVNIITEKKRILFVLAGWD